jgi:hypothetical protein
MKTFALSSILNRSPFGVSRQSLEGKFSEVQMQDPA